MASKKKKPKYCPCTACRFGCDPVLCDRKGCADWRDWWLSRWEQIYQWGQLYQK